MNEIFDCLRVRQVALERGRGHQQVMPDQPGDGLGLRCIQPKARPKLQSNLGADLAMVSAASLGDVVQEHRDIERPPRSRFA